MTRSRKSGSDWCAKATRVGEFLPLARLYPAVLAKIAGARKAEPWVVAFSGGADSLALLLLLWAHFPERRKQLVALHFNHRLRGRAADADEKFCVDVCRTLGVRLRTGRWRAARPGASEAEARTARHDFFRKEMKRLGATKLWLAHQQDDIAETMLMRLGRGSGTAGLAAPRPVQPMPERLVHLRPLLTLAKADLIAALHRAGVKWREDATNTGDAYLRNRVRRDVLPRWLASDGRDVLAGVALARERLEEDDVALEAWVDRTGALEGKALVLTRLVDVPRAVRRRALHRWLLRVRPVTDLSRQGFTQLLQAVELSRATRFSLGAKAFAVIRQGRLTLKKSPSIPK